MNFLQLCNTETALPARLGGGLMAAGPGAMTLGYLHID